MSYLTDLVPDSVQQTADTFRQQAQAEWANLRNNTTLNAGALRQAMAKVAVTLYEKMDGLQNASTGQTAAAREDALRRAFGTASADPTAAISARDAADRASRLGPDDWQEASDLLDRAALNYDTTLAAAIGYRAWELTGGVTGFGLGAPGWRDVLDKYLDANPQAAAAIGDLQATTNSIPKIASVAAFMVVLPSELAGLDRWQVRALAGA